MNQGEGPGKREKKKGSKITVTSRPERAWTVTGLEQTTGSTLVEHAINIRGYENKTEF